MSREDKLAKNTIILSIGTILPKLSTIITLPILTGYMSKEAYGTYDLISVLVTLVLPIATVQIQTAAFRFLLEEKDDEARKKRIISNIIFFTIATSVAALVLLWIFLPTSDPVTKALTLGYFLADILVKTTRQIARGLSKNKLYAVSAMLSTVCKVAFTVLFVWVIRRGLNGALLALMLGSSISFVVLAFQLRLWRYLSPRLMDKGELSRLLKYSWPMVPANMSMWITRVSDRFVVTAVMGVAANAVYSVAHKIPSLLTLAQNAFALAWQESATIASKDQDAEQYYSDMFRTMFDLLAGFLGLIIAVTPLVFIIFVKGDYGEAYPQIPILILATFFYSISEFLGGIFIAYKQSKSVGITTAIAAAINLVVDIGLIRFIGLYAASLSTLVCYIVLFIIRMVTLRKLVTIRCDVPHMLLLFGIMVAECFLCSLRRTPLDIINACIALAVFFVYNMSFVRIILNLVKKRFR